MIRNLALSMLVPLILATAPAHARNGVTPGPGGFEVTGEANKPGHGSSAAPGDGAVSDKGAQPAITLHHHPCDQFCPPNLCAAGQTEVYESFSYGVGMDGGSPTVVCVGQKAVVTAAAVANAFRHIGVPTPTLHIQPVKGRTLVNFKTNFYATGGAAFTRTVTLLGQHVTLRIHADDYTFAFGDGHHLTTTDPGAAYPNLTDHHVYLHTGVIHPSLDTTWAADYRINAGAWQSVTGTVTVHGPTQRLEVTTARPVLVNPYER
jgi:hypothetical protein